MTSIGCRCKGGNVYSRAILITRTLSGSQDPAVGGQKKSRPLRHNDASLSDMRGKAASSHKPVSYKQAIIRGRHTVTPAVPLFFTLQPAEAIPHHRDTAPQGNELRWQ